MLIPRWDVILLRVNPSDIELSFSISRFTAVFQLWYFSCGISACAFQLHKAALRAGPVDATARVNNQRHRQVVTVANKKCLENAFTIHASCCFALHFGSSRLSLDLF